MTGAGTLKVLVGYKSRLSVPKLANKHSSSAQLAGKKPGHEGLRHMTHAALCRAQARQAGSSIIMQGVGMMGAVKPTYSHEG